MFSVVGRFCNSYVQAFEDFLRRRKSGFFAPSILHWHSLPPTRVTLWICPASGPTQPRTSRGPPQCRAIRIGAFFCARIFYQDSSLVGLITTVSRRLLGDYSVSARNPAEGHRRPDRTRKIAVWVSWYLKSFVLTGRPIPYLLENTRRYGVRPNYRPKSSFLPYSREASL